MSFIDIKDKKITKKFRYKKNFKQEIFIFKTGKNKVVRTIKENPKKVR